MIFRCVLQCKPYHVGKTAVIIGDAAHAMVPFYAQGMNTVSLSSRRENWIMLLVA